VQRSLSPILGTVEICTNAVPRPLDPNLPLNDIWPMRPFDDLVKLNLKRLEARLTVGPLTTSNAISGLDPPLQAMINCMLLILTRPLTAGRINVCGNTINVSPV